MTPSAPTGVSVQEYDVDTVNPAAWAVFLTLTVWPGAPSQVGTAAPVQNLASRLRDLANIGVAFGAGVRHEVATEDQTSVQSSAMFMWRLIGGADRGLGPAVRLSLLPRKTSVVSPGANADSFGTLKVWPMLGGVTWKQPLSDAMSLHLTAMAGFSFNRVDRGDRRLRDPRLERDQAIAAIRNSVAGELTARLWIEVTSRLGIATSVSLAHLRPRVTMLDGTTRRWTADHLRVEAGAAFQVWPWKKP